MPATWTRPNSTTKPGQAIFDDHGFDDGTASMLANLGMIANSRAQFERGHRLQFEAMQIYQRQGNRPAQATVLHNIGLARFQAGELDRARSALQQALRIRDALALTDGHRQYPLGAGRYRGPERPSGRGWTTV